jgi:imidazolonepropionase
MKIDRGKTKVRAVINAGELIVGSKPPVRKGNPPVTIIENGGLIIEGNQILYSGSMDSIKPYLSGLKPDEILDVSGRLVTPGLVDCHTHSVFYGTRENEYQMRIAGATYQEISEKGGGILNSAKRVRSALVSDLVDYSMKNLFLLLSYGITTIEAKRGDGLSTESEINMLRAIRILNDTHPVDIIPTFMGAHEIPTEYRDGGRQEYLKLIMDEMIPQISSEKLAVYCDVFCEEGVFTVEESRQILLQAQKYGMKARIHADEIKTTDGAVLASEINAKSADHLGAISEKGISSLASSDTVATLLPGTVLFLNLRRFAPARSLIDSGAIVALSTDFNPGSSPTVNLPLIMSIAASRMRMTIPECWAAVTVNSAYSLDLLPEYGTLLPGSKSDIVVFEASNMAMPVYSYGVNLVKYVIKGGELVVENS